MYKFIALLALSAGLVVVSCKRERTTETQETITPKAVKDTSAAALIKNWPSAGSHSGDTINIYGKFLVFYSPSPAEATDPEKEFIEMSQKIATRLSANPEIKVVFTSARFLRVFNRITGKPMTIDRSGFDSRVGCLVTDGGQPPKIKRGIASEEEYTQLIQQYFMLPS